MAGKGFRLFLKIISFSGCIGVGYAQLHSYALNRRRKLREYQYTNSKGEKVSIRKDNATKYPEGGKGDQGDHYNAGETGRKLDQHHTYGD